MPAGQSSLFVANSIPAYSRKTNDNMKQAIRMAYTVTMLLMLVTTASTLFAQNTKQDKKAKQAATITNMVKAQNYVFKAQTMLPMSGRTRQLTSEYDVRISQDTVIAFLPYFGRAYSGIDPTSSGGIQFTSTKFTYDVKDKKDGWDIVIKPSDARDVQQLSFSIFTNGNASLNVTSTNRQPISFNGYVTEVKAKKKK
ncbi:MAG: DUF4251 domain-containing protein [Chitinophagaceae bacterium]